MDKISFKSYIRPISKYEFTKVTSNFGKDVCVNYPWTVRQSVLADKAYTKEVYDCTVCGITDGLKVLMLHICPTRSENSNFLKIIEYIKTQIDINTPNLQGFLFGSKNMPFCEKSTPLFRNFEKFFIENKIPFSKIKGGLHVNDIAYSSVTDEWLISHEMLDNDEVKYAFKRPGLFLEKFFNEVDICEADKVSW